MRRHLRTLAWLVLLGMAFPLRAGEKARDVDRQAVAAVLDQALKDFEAPGLAVAVVHDDKVVSLEGHGVKDLANPSPVTPDTVFAIASCSKAMTATAIGFLVAEGKMGWNDPVR